MGLSRLLCLVIVLGLCPVGGHARCPTLAVLYPETPAPYRQVFADLLKGIQSQARHTRTYALTEAYDPAALTGWLERHAPSAVVTLGNVPYQAYRAAGLPWPYVVGALDSSPHTMPAVSSISLSVAPSLLFATLEAVLPEVRRVYTVFRPARDRWIIERARKAASRYHIELHARAAVDRRGSANYYWETLKTANPATDALWLPMDTQLVDDEVVLPLVIQASWTQRIPVFSTSLEHVDMGVLFALYPDPEALGRRLAGMALRLAEHPNEQLGIEPLRDVSAALNLRIAAHLGLAIDAKIQRQFDLILRPE